MLNTKREKDLRRNAIIVLQSIVDQLKAGPGPLVELRRDSPNFWGQEVKATKLQRLPKREV